MYLSLLSLLQSSSLSSSSLIFLYCTVLELPFFFLCHSCYNCVVVVSLSLLLSSALFSLILSTLFIIIYRCVSVR